MSKMMVRYTVSLLLLISLWIGCTETIVPPAPTLWVEPTTEMRLVGLVDEAQALGPLVAYDNAGLQWRFAGGDGQTLLTAVADGALDAALVHHVPLSAETLWHNPVALDGVVVIVHPENQVTTLTLGEVQAIYSGQLGQWAAVGGANAPIELMLRGRGSGVRELFDVRVMGPQRVSVNTEIRPNSASILTAVANNQHAIGITTYSSLTDTVRAVAIDGITPQPELFHTQQYPLTTPLYWVSQTEPAGEIRGLLAFLQSQTGQTMLGEKFGRILWVE